MLEAVWLIPALPLAGFLTLLVLGRRLGEPLAGWLATSAMGASFLATLTVFAGLLSEEAEERFFLQRIFTWVPAGSFSVDIGFFVDPLAITMCLFITGVGSLIHLYSVGYMHGDPGYSKFFLYLNLFAASMLVLVLGDNLLLTFLGWEGVGACSYLLISFWFGVDANASAGKKAFVTNRIGDFGFMLATFAVFSQIGSIRYADVLTGNFSSGWATVIVLLFLLGAAGKSAQIPLFVWLPDAMAGPTPVSALIHAATMVTSGVYLLTRLNPVLAQADGWATGTIAWVGVITALIAALAAVIQNDIKKVLAYSTISQLGYLFLAVGVGAYIPAIFHMVTHAFFKALLFLGSGSVIHGLDDEQDMRRMGGLGKLMPITAGTFIVGWLAIAGVPPFSGFWSKDEILLSAWNHPSGGKVLWLLGLVTALLTAFYMTRQVILTFFGRTRFFDARQSEIDAAFAGVVAAAAAVVAEAEAAVESAGAAVEKARADVAKRQAALDKALASQVEASAAFEASDTTSSGHDKVVKTLEKAEKAIPKAEGNLEKATTALAAAEAAVAVAEAKAAEARTKAEVSASESSSVPRVPQYVSAFSAAPDVSEFEDQLPDSYRRRQEYHPHESPWTMTLPLVALAGLAAAGGALNLPFAHDLHFLGNWLEPSLFGNEAHGDAGAVTKWVLAIVAVLVGLAAIVAAFAVYLHRRVDPERIEQKRLGLAVDYDEALAALAGGPGLKGFELVAWFDRTFVDGAVNGAATVVGAVGTRLRVLQPGFVRSYALGITLGTGFVALWFLLKVVVVMLLASEGASFALLPALVVVPLLTAVVIALIPASRAEYLKLAALGGSTLAAALSVYALAAFETADGGLQFVSRATWVESLGLEWFLAVDGISLFLVVLTGVLFPITILATEPHHDPKPYYMWLMVLMAGSFGVFMALDLLLFFLFFEIVLVPMYFLIGGWGHGRRVYAALKFFIYTMAGSALMLVGIVSLAFLTARNTGQPLTFDVTALADAQALGTTAQRLIFASFALAFAVKVPLFPLHTWLPDAHTEAPTAGSVILAGVMLKLGTYGFIRFGVYLFPQAAHDLAPVFFTLGVVGIVYGAIAATMQKDLKRLVAYSSVAHLGFIIIGVFAMNNQGLQGSILQMVNHGISTGALFILVGWIYERRHTRQIAELGGLQKPAPLMAAAFTWVMLSSIGLPGLNGFVGEFLILLGGFSAARWWTVVAVSGVILAALYLLWAYQRVFHGEPTGENADMPDLTFSEGLAILPLLGLIVFMGVYPKPVLDRIEPAVDVLIVHVSEHVDDFDEPEPESPTRPAGVPQLVEALEEGESGGEGGSPAHQDSEEGEG